MGSAGIRPEEFKVAPLANRLIGAPSVETCNAAIRNKCSVFAINP